MRGPFVDSRLETRRRELRSGVAREVGLQVSVRASALCHGDMFTDARRPFHAAPPPTFPPRLTHTYSTHSLNSASPLILPSCYPPKGLTLVHFTAQPEPFLTQNTPCTTPSTP